MGVIRYYVDEHIAGAVVRALRARGVDAKTVTEARLRQAEDDEHLAFALRENRVTVTCDADYLRLHAQGVEHAGIVYSPRQMGIGALVRRLLLIHGVFTAEEIAAMGDMVTSPSYRHVPTGRLALLAQRLGRVFASASTWYRLVRERGWRRPRLRIHPPGPREGVRADVPNEIWHIDTTVVRLLDGTRAFVQAVIDNFSRRILAWRVSDRRDAGTSVALLLEAGSAVDDTLVPQLMADRGTENCNRKVDALVEQGRLRRVLAMVDVAFSNSLIEAWWRSLKHNWLFLQQLDSVAAVRRHVAFYVEEHNTSIPHSAFQGQTPDEMYFGRGDDLPDRLAAARTAARELRLTRNRARQCGVCA